MRAGFLPVWAAYSQSTCLTQCANRTDFPQFIQRQLWIAELTSSANCKICSYISYTYPPLIKAHCTCPACLRHSPISPSLPGGQCLSRQWSLEVKQILKTIWCNSIFLENMSFAYLVPGFYVPSHQITNTPYLCPSIERHTWHWDPRPQDKLFVIQL